MKTDRNVKQYATGTDVAYMIGEKVVPQTRDHNSVKS